MEPRERPEWPPALNATLGVVNGIKGVRYYDDPLKEHAALQNAAGVLDLSQRSRLCLTGTDRGRFLNGQVTNQVAALPPGQGCYAALVTAKGRMESDLHIHCLPDELLLDFEPDLTRAVSDRLNKFIVADEVEVVDLQSHYGLWSVQGPKAACVLGQLQWAAEWPSSEYQSLTLRDDAGAERLIVCLPRLATRGFDLFVPVAEMRAVGEALVAAAKAVGGCLCGWEAMEMARIEAGIPRYGQDMDMTTIPLEAGLEAGAVRYDKGCYVGQEVINRIHSIGQVTRSLRGLLLPDDLDPLPVRGDKLWHGGQEVGHITSSVHSPAFQRKLALGYVRKEVNEPGKALTLRVSGGDVLVRVLPLPFATASL
ncbi:MAG: aminomethyl transferase family protein [Verrucomicrobia bacterium]|nr:aminomethyl transferase family protein [Verrucomicrobiota bacterium]